MRTASAILNRLERNAHQRRALREAGLDISRQEEIHLEYLRIEAQTFNEMLMEVQNNRWSAFRTKKFSLFMAISAMSIYVLGIFYMFQELDLSKVEQWQFAMTALPFWLILMLIPVALITFITTRNTRS